MTNYKFLAKMESMKPFYSPAELKVYSFILNNSEKIPKLTVRDFALESGVSEASIIRFTRKIGFAGYTEFKIAISSSLQVSTVEDPLIVNLDKADNPLEIYNKLSLFTITSIRATFDSLDGEELSKAVDLIEETKNKGGRVYLVGSGASSVIAKQMEVKLMRLNINTVFFEDSHLQFESMINIEESDLVLCFTTLGRSSQTHDMIAVAEKNGARVILVTQYGNQTLSGKADATLLISSVENNLRLASQTAMIIQSMVVDTLFLALALRDFDAINKDVEKTKQTFVDFGYYTKL